MKKYLSLTLLVVCFSFFAKAQTTGKDSLLSDIAKDVCTELSKKDFSKITKEEFNMQLGLTIMPSISSHMEPIKKYYGADITAELLRELGTEVGIKLAVECPTFIKLIAEKKELFDNSEEKEKPIGQTISGTLQKIVPGDFTYFQIKDVNGKILKIWWLEPFTGADQLTEQLLNKPVLVTYSVKQTYNAQMQEYIGLKVAAKLQVIQ